MRELGPQCADLSKFAKQTRAFSDRPRLYYVEDVHRKDMEAQNKDDDCWLIIGNPGEKKVYDVTKFLEDHPGGPVNCRPLTPQTHILVGFEYICVVRRSSPLALCDVHMSSPVAPACIRNSSACRGLSAFRFASRE